MNDSQLNEINQILLAVLSSDNTLREAAEKSFHHFLCNSATILMFGLLKLVRSSQIIEVRQVATVLLRSNLPRGDPIIFHTLPEQLQYTIKSELLEAMVREEIRAVRNQLTDIISELASILLQQHRDLWPELIPFLFDNSKNANEAICISCLSILGKMSIKCCDYLQLYLNDILSLYIWALQQPSVKIRTTAAVSACETLSHLDINQDAKRYAELQDHFIPCFFQTISDDMNMGHQDGAVAIITSMVELAQEQSTFFRNHLAETGHRLLGIVNAKQIDNSLRHMALELMVTFSESNPGLVRKFPEFITNSVQAALSLILCVSDDLAWTSIRESEEEENPNLDCGEKAMDRIAVAIEGKKLTPIIAPFIDSCLPDHNWRFRFAGRLMLLYDILSLTFFMVVSFYPWSTTP